MKKTLLIALVVLLFSAAFLLYKPLIRSFAQQPNQGLVDGLGTECALETSPTRASISGDKVASFIASRSGITLDTTNLTNLKVQEGDFRAAALTGYSRAEIKTIVWNTWFETFKAQNTDAKVNYIGSVWRTVPALNSPYVLMRPYGYGLIKNADWLTFAKQYRDAEPGSTPSTWQTDSHNKLNTEIDGFLDAASASIPDWNRTAYSPMQVFLVAYSVLVGDSLTGNATQLQATIQHMEDYLYTNKGVARSSSGKKAYGLNGYLYSTPADVFFSGGVQSGIYNKMRSLRP